MKYLWIFPSFWSFFKFLCSTNIKRKLLLKSFFHNFLETYASSKKVSFLIWLISAPAGYWLKSVAPSIVKTVRKTSIYPQMICWKYQLVKYWLVVINPLLIGSTSRKIANKFSWLKTVGKPAWVCRAKISFSICLIKNSLGSSTKW